MKNENNFMPLHDPSKQRKLKYPELPLRKFTVLPKPSTAIRQVMAAASFEKWHRWFLSKSLREGSYY